MGKVIAIYNQKGGVGKSVTTSNLAYELSARNKAVLMVDADQQENLSISTGVIPKQCNRTFYDVLMDEIHDISYDTSLSDVIVKLPSGPHIIPGSVEQASIDEELFSIMKFETPLESWLKQYQKDLEIQGRIKSLPPDDEGIYLEDEVDRYIKLYAGYKQITTELTETLIQEGFLDKRAMPPAEAKDGRFVVKKILDKIKDQYDFILVDCPPALSALTKSVLNSASSVLVPVTLEPYSASGLSHLAQSVGTIKQLSNPRLRISGLLYTMVDDRLVLSHDIKTQLEYFRQLFYIYDTQIPRSTDVNKAIAEMKPLMEFNKNNIARLAYSKFADEFLKREA